MDHINSTYKYVGTIAVGTAIHPFYKAPADAKGGGITITEAFAVSTTALAAGSAWNFELVTMSSGAQAALNGTVGTLAAGSAWTAGTVRSITISDGWVDGGEYVGARLIGTAVNGDSHGLTVFFNAVMGR
jgi:hypothetical protein